MNKNSKTIFTLTFLLLVVLITSLQNKNKKSKKLNLQKTHKSHMKAPNTNDVDPALSNQEKMDIVLPDPEPKSNDQKIDFSSARNIECNEFNCATPNHCLPDKTTCNCGLENAEFDLNKPLQPNEKRIEPTKNTLFCSYFRKNQLTYFLLELLLNCGAGHFYAGNIGLGVAKLLLLVLPCFIMCFSACLGGMSSDGEGAAGKMMIGSMISYALLCALSIWWLVDVIIIATGGYNDGNNVPLKHW